MPISISEASRLILGAVAPVASEILPARRALGRVLAEPIVAREDTPFDALSAMDGYAVAAESLPGRFRVAGSAVHAGAEPGPALAAGTTRRVMTGARIPDGADAVVMQEEVLLEEGEFVRIQRGAKAGLHIRPAGDAIRAGETVLAKGETVRARSMPLLLASGHTSVIATRVPRIGVVTSGDELVEPGLPMRAGGVRETIRAGILAAVFECGCEAVDIGLLPDDPNVIESKMASAAGLDGIVSIGGASVGEKDHTRASLEKVGMDLKFWGVEVKPGKPTAFGLLEKHPVFVLPGNPVSAFVMFEVLVRPALRALLGGRALWRPSIRLPLAASATRHTGRPEFLRARIDWAAGNVALAPDQGSHQIRGLGRADALVFVGADAAALAEGEVHPAMWLGGEETEAEPTFRS